MVFCLVRLAFLVVFFVFDALAFSTAYNMSCGLSQGVSYDVPWLFVEFFSSRECRRSWILFHVCG